MTPDTARSVAMAAIGLIAADEQIALRFLQLAGLTPDQLRGGLDDPEILGGVLDFVLGDDGLAEQLCIDANLTPEQLMRARMALPGAAPESW